MRVCGKIGPGAALLAITLAGCGGGNGNSNTRAGAAPSGTVIVDGSSTVFRISSAAQEGYNQVNPEVTVVVDNHGTGGGFGRYLQGEVDIVDASRAAKPEEEAKAKAQGIDWTRFLVGYDGITLTINPKNDAIKELSVEQLKAIWAPDSTVKTWKDVDPSWPDRKIVLYSPDKDSGTFEFFTEAIVGKAKSQRDDVQSSSDDNILVSGVAGDVDGLGYFGYAYYAANRDKLRAVPIRSGPDAKAVMPGPATILDKSYTPLARPLYIYVKNSAMRRPEVAAFLKYYIENVGTLAEKAGYVAPTAEDQAANRKTLTSTGGGTTDVDTGKAATN
ncbi:MAG: phosphate transport system substrate-binding protein [Chloroflexota bacterium]|nr:phosphate transport system substrate-binding protein [Chloroflexota bacterium]